MSIHQKIRALREGKGWSMHQLAEAISKAEGLSRPLSWQTIQQWEREGGTAPKRTRLNVVASVLGTTAYELTYEGPHFSAGISAKEQTQNYLSGRIGAAAPTMQPVLAWEHEDELPEGEFVMVPRLDVHLSAGHGRGLNQIEIQFDEKQPQAFRAEWIREQHLKPKKLAAMRARGNSMEPTIHNGDSLLVDTSQTEVIDGRVYALWYGDGERVKRLYRLPGGGLRIRSDNAQEHPEINVSAAELESVRILGRVVHRSGTGGL